VKIHAEACTRKIGSPLKVEDSVQLRFPYFKNKKTRMLDNILVVGGEIEEECLIFHTMKRAE
jgi:hypothetical protein